MFHNDLVMEGGAIDVNGAGTLLTTTSCLLHPNRNPGVGQAEIERHLKAYYGQRHVVWLGEGIAGDDTDGHVDDLARFIGERLVVTAIEDDPADANYRVLRANRRALDRARDADGRGFEILELPMPRPVVHEGQRLPATYVNFLFVNGGLLVPTFGDRSRDRVALGPAAAGAAATQGDRRRLPRADLGAGGDPLPHPAAAARLTLRRPRYSSDACGRFPPAGSSPTRRCRARPGRRWSTATRSGCCATPRRTTRPGSTPSPPPSGSSTSRSTSSTTTPRASGSPTL